MTIHDISQNLLHCKVFGDDTVPSVTIVKNIADGYRLSDINMCLHNGTHIDAPSHFVDNGSTISEIDLQKCIGECTVVRSDSDIDSEMVQSIGNCTRLLIDGKGQLTPNGAEALVNRGCLLVGIARASIANEQYSTQVHNVLLANEVVVLEGLRLGHICQERYFLIALPLNIGQCEASPVRAVLIEY